MPKLFWKSLRMLETQVRHKERLSALGQFAAGIAHELRNPLGTIRLRTQMWQRSQEPGAAAKNAPVILEEIDRLDQTISRLLYFSRPLELDRQLVDLRALCGRAAATWSEKSAPSRVAVHCETPLGEVIVDCDASRMVEVLDNLLENAIHSASGNTAGEKIVTVTASIADAHATMAVTDNGPGFTPTALAHALDPFFTTKEVGTGLRLSISFEIVEAHGGELVLQNRPEGGAVALIRLPLAVDAGLPVASEGLEGAGRHG